jgi:hypothetical protein
VDASEQWTQSLEITGFPLPSYLDACVCGARTIDLRGYIEHSNLRATCVACGAERPDSISRSVLGETKSNRSKRFEITQTARFDVFRRDKFCCVHCGQPAPRAGDAFAKVRDLLISAVGSEHRLVVARHEHATTCVTCGNTLPGIFQSIPYDVIQQLSSEQRAHLLAVIDGQRLTIDHLLPVSILEIDGVVRGSVENKLVTNALLATSCMDCNWGRHETLEPWPEFKSLLGNVVLKNHPRKDELIGYVQGIYFRVGLQLKNRAS